MPKCEKCPREVEEGKTLCRYHRAEQQAERAGWAEEAKKWGKVLPLILPILIPVVGKIIIRRKQ